MNFETIGVQAGRAYTQAGKLWVSVRTYVRWLVLAVALFLGIPPITQYWLRHVEIPAVPLSAILLLAVASVFMLAFALLVYIVCHFLKKIAEIEPAMQSAEVLRRKQRLEPTEGTYQVATDAQMWNQEAIGELRSQGIGIDQIDLLTKNGVITEDDKKAIEEMAITATRRRNGRT